MDSHNCSPHGQKGYPDGHADNPIDEDTEIDRLKAKVDAGADFILTQLFYDAEHFLKWYRKVREKGSFPKLSMLGLY